MNIYGFTIRQRNGFAELKETGYKTPLTMAQSTSPLATAAALRDLARYAIERAEILEGMERAREATA
jgi:hypothetical protein